jgi:D-3-phosphoglycerate dehydrogenase / 2-oxoglutarate reductase
VMGSGIDPETVIREGKDCSGILTRNAHIDARVMDGCPNLKVISMHGVGVDCIDVEAATKRNIQVTNAANSNQRSVAEYTIGLILMLAKKSVDYNNGLKKGNMEVRKEIGSNVSGKTLGIIGMGNIGTQVAKMAAFGLNMKVIGYNRHIEEKEKTDFGYLTADMKEVISQADFLSLHLPGGAGTRHLIGKEELALMKKTAYLINTGRGEVIDEEELIHVLQENRIQGAALDVFEGNLPKRDNPLLSMPQVIVTPHTAAFTKESLERMAYQSALGIVEVIEGKPISYAVNQLHNSFEEDQSVKQVMDYFRHEFGYQYK